MAETETRAESLDLEKAAKTLDEVEEALERLESGSYGRCGGCGAPIGDETLSADPLARLCGSCSSRRAEGTEESS